MLQGVMMSWARLECVFQRLRNAMLSMVHPRNLVELGCNMLSNNPMKIHHHEVDQVPKNSHQCLIAIHPTINSFSYLITQSDPSITDNPR